MPKAFVALMGQAFAVGRFEIQRTTKSLDQRHGAGLCGLSSESRFLDQVDRDGPVDDSQHPAHQFRTTDQADRPGRSI